MTRSVHTCEEEGEGTSREMRMQGSRESANASESVGIEVYSRSGGGGEERGGVGIQWAKGKVEATMANQASIPSVCFVIKPPLLDHCNVHGDVITCNVSGG
jgi:hypothetical protein